MRVAVGRKGVVADFLVFRTFSIIILAIQGIFYKINDHIFRIGIKSKSVIIHYNYIKHSYFIIICLLKHVYILIT